MPLAVARSVLAFSCCLFFSLASAQDTRTVVEPRIPEACTVLEANLSADHGRLTDAQEKNEDTQRIQQAIDQCEAGHSVKLRSKGKRHIFLSGPLQLRRGVTLWIDSETALFASRNPRDYDVTPGSCGLVNDKGHGCKSLLLAAAAPDSGIMGDGVIDGRGGATILGGDQTWWDLAHIAKVQDKAQNCPRLLLVQHSDNFTLYRITLRNSPNFHVLVDQTNGFTAWGVHIDTPGTARNTDGIDPSSSTNVTITHSYIRTGDDDVAIKAGRGGPSTHMTIEHNHFYSGHGMSIGSETNGGASNILVRDLSIDGADNGIRIKSDMSRGGLVHDVLYDDICVRGVKNPIVMTPHYSNRPGNLMPVYRDIRLHDVHILTPGVYTFEGDDAQHPVEVSLDNVVADGLSDSKIHATFAKIALGPAMGNLIPQGDGVSTSNVPDGKPAQAVACQDRFPAYPAADKQTVSAGKVPEIDPNFYVAADGSGDYHSIQSAIDAVPDSGGTLIIGPGTYRETVKITKPNVHLRGTGADPSSTTVVFDNSAGTSGGTLHSATVEVRGDNFLAENLTFANDWNRTHEQGAQGSQALALLVTGDKAVFSRMRFLGNQDTLYAGSRNCAPDGNPCTPARQYFTDCFISGNVDFIFGDGKAYFHNCEIQSTPRGGGYVTAQSKHYPEEDSAFVFDHCRLTAEPGAMNVWLGRPWRPYATVIFLHTWMGDHILPGGWREWHPGETHSIETVYYAEYDSMGPGSHPQERDPHTHLLTAAEAAKFSLPSFFSDWKPESVLRGAASQ